MLVIQAATSIIENGKISKRNVIIIFDSQAAIKALSSNVMNSKMVFSCRRILNEIT